MKSAAQRSAEGRRHGKPGNPQWASEWRHRLWGRHFDEIKDGERFAMFGSTRVVSDVLLAHRLARGYEDMHRTVDCYEDFDMSRRLPVLSGWNVYEDCWV